MSSSKRFTDANKWRDPWFFELTPELKLLWVFLCDNCDNAGVWPVNQRLAETYLGMPIDWAKALNVFDGRVRILPCGTKWFLTKFIPFQNPNGVGDTSWPHRQIRQLLAKHNLSLGGTSLPSSLPGTLVGILGGRLPGSPKGKGKGKDKGKDKSVRDQDEGECREGEGQGEEGKGQGEGEGKGKGERFDDDAVGALTFPLERGTWTLTPRDYGELTKAHPAEYVDSEINKACLWLKVNPARRKTARGMMRFLTGWLARNAKRNGAQPIAFDPTAKGFCLSDHIEPVEPTQEMLEIEAEARAHDAAETAARAPGKAQDA